MKKFFKVMTIEAVLECIPRFQPVSAESVPIGDALDRVLSADVAADTSLPGFNRSVMDGYALQAVATFGAGEGNPALLKVIGSVQMGEASQVTVGPGEAVKISTGGMLPEGTDAVVMIEHTQLIEPDLLEIYRSVAPGSHLVRADEDYRQGTVALEKGCLLRPQEIGLLAAFGRASVSVYRRPVVGIVSTGDEVVGIDQQPGPGRIRDINTYSLSAMVSRLGGVAVSYGIVPDRFEDLHAVCRKAVRQSDMILISGGSSVGTRDFTIQALEELPGSEILAHGISISPGKPTILASAMDKPVWGLPGHVVSAMVVFEMVVRPFLEHIRGKRGKGSGRILLPARISRNLASAQGRVDCVRVCLTERGGELWADPILGKSALIHTMVQADGLLVIDLNSEGVEKGDPVFVIPIQ